jgi:hypothetical protein
VQELYNFLKGLGPRLLFHGPICGSFLMGAFSLLAFVYQGKDIVFKFFIEYNSIRDFGPWVVGLFL